jgi:hypothetical protein
VNSATVDLGTCRETATDGGDLGSSGSIPSARLARKARRSFGACWRSLGWLGTATLSGGSYRRARGEKQREGERTAERERKRMRERGASSGLSPHPGGRRRRASLRKIG